MYADAVDFLVGMPLTSSFIRLLLSAFTPSSAYSFLVTPLLPPDMSRMTKEAKSPLGSSLVIYAQGYFPVCERRLAFLTQDRPLAFPYGARIRHTFGQPVVLASALPKGYALSRSEARCRPEWDIRIIVIIKAEVGIEIEVRYSQSAFPPTRQDKCVQCLCLHFLSRSSGPHDQYRGLRQSYDDMRMRKTSVWNWPHVTECSMSSQSPILHGAMHEHWSCCSSFTNGRLLIFTAYIGIATCRVRCARFICYCQVSVSEVS